MAKELPILFSTEMVDAILAGLKTKTRRTKGITRITGVNGMKTMTFPATGKTETFVDAKFVTFDVEINSGLISCPYGAIGDKLWVRETFGYPLGQLTFKAGFNPHNVHGIEPRWKPSIHMKKESARIWLEITDIQVERLHSITESDAIAEGVECVDQKHLRYKDYLDTTPGSFVFAVGSFKSLWKSINGLDSWEVNPFVWVISFKVLSTTGNPKKLTEELQVAS